LKVFDAPDASLALAHVNLQWFDVVVADAPLPFSGLNVAPEGTASFVQCAPLGTSNSTVKPVAPPGPLFFTVMVPQKFGPSYELCVTESEHALKSSSLAPGSSSPRCAPQPALAR
jgi:hypothetical protein